MKQFSDIFAFELKYYFKNKLFIGLTVFLAVAIAVVMFIPNISTLFQNNSTDAEREKMLLCVKEKELSQSALGYFSAAFDAYDVILSDQDHDLVKEKIISGEYSCAFIIKSTSDITYLVNDLSLYDTNSAVAASVMQKLYQLDIMLKGGLSESAASDAMSVQIDCKTESLGVDQSQNYWYAYIMIMALYMVIMFYGQMVATNVATEKSSRAMELLITSAKPTAMMFGKVLSSCIAGFVQMAAIFGSAILSYNINRDKWADIPIVKSIFDMPLSLFGFMLMFFVLGFLIYAFMYGAVGSTASKLEDINTSVLPITMLFVACFIAIMISLASGTVESTLMKVCSFIPFTSPMAMFTRIAMSEVPWYEIAASVGLLIFSAVAVGIISARIYKMGVLLYGNPPKLSALLKKAIKNKET